MSRGTVRAPERAGQFYDRSASVLQRVAREYASTYTRLEGLGILVGGVVPHAGWVFSGPTAGKVFAALSSEAKPQTYVLLGAVHSWRGEFAAVFPSGAWSTPLGQIRVDEELAAAVLEAGKGVVIASGPAHEGEHSIEVQLPFIQVLAPKAEIVPIAVPPDARVVDVGNAVAAAIRKTRRSAVVVASTDLTHYGMGYGSPDHGPLSKAMGWMRENDGRILRLAESLQAEKIVPEAEENFNACGAGALAAAVAAARELGAVAGRLLEYTTSADVLHETDADRAVGYAGIVFERPAPA